MATRDTGGQQRTTRTREETDEVEASVDTEVAERHKEVTEDIDSILDEIDEVLEENAEEFVRHTCRRAGSDTPTTLESAASQAVPRLSGDQIGRRVRARTGHFRTDCRSTA